MTAQIREYFAKAMSILEEEGLLLQSSSELPDVSRIISTQRTSGSWWTDPMASKIFAVSEMLSDHPDVTLTKLVSGKVTLVHRRLWSRLVAIGKARDDWQTQSLSPDAQLLLREVDKSGSLRTDQLGYEGKFGKKPGTTALELELRLLIHSEQFHTETGYHTKLLETWDVWSTRMKLRSKAIEPWRAQHFFEKRLEELNEKYGARAELPWQSKKLLKVKRT